MNENLAQEIARLSDRVAGKTKAPLIARIAATPWANSYTVGFELLIGLLLKNSEVDCKFWEPSDDDVAEVIRIASKIYNLTREHLKQKGAHQRALLGLTCRHDVDPDWIVNASKQVYAGMNSILEDKLGYTIDDSVLFSNLLIDLIIHASEKIKSAEKDGQSVQKLWRCFYLFPRAISQKYKLDQKRFLSYFNSLRCDFGKNYGGPEEILCNSPVSTKPFIYVTRLDHDEVILCPIPKLLIYNLLDQIENNLIQTCENQPEILKRLEHEKASFLQRNTMSTLSYLLQTDQAYQNLFYPDPGYSDARRTELDGLCILDNNLFLVECKSGSYRPRSKIGFVPKLTEDLRKTIHHAFQQAKRARDYFHNCDTPVFYSSANRKDDRISVKLDKSKIKNIYLISSTLSNFAGITTNLSGLRSMGLFGDNEYPWAVYSGDLSILKEFFNSSCQFIHYLNLRLEAEYKSYIAFTELAFLGAYKDNFLTSINYQFDTKDVTHIFLEFEEAIIRELAKKREGKVDCVLRRDIPPLFQSIIETVEALRPYGFTDVGISLLEIPTPVLRDFAEKIEATKQSKILQVKDLHSEVMVDLKTGVGISYTIAGEKIEPDDMREALFFDYDSSSYRGRVSKWISIVERKGDPLPISMAAVIEPKSH
jgi:hypothetical protein